MPPLDHADAAFAAGPPALCLLEPSAMFQLLPLRASRVAKPPPISHLLLGGSFELLGIQRRQPLGMCSLLRDFCAHISHHRVLQTSEQNLEAELDSARRTCRHQTAESWRTEVSVRQPEVRSVEEIENFGAELQSQAFAKHCVLDC